MPSASKARLRLWIWAAKIIEVDINFAPREQEMMLEIETVK
jgi:hypothetical protein